MRPGVHAPREEPPQREAGTLQLEWLLPATATEKPTAPQRPSLAKNKYINKIVLFLKKEMWVASSLSIFKSNQVLGKEMATHSSPLAWRIPWTEEPAGLRSMGSQESDTTERLSHTLYSHVPNASRTQRVQTWSRHFLWNVSPSGICLAESWPTEVTRLNSFRGIFRDPFPLIPTTHLHICFEFSGVSSISHSLAKYTLSLSTRLSYLFTEKVSDKLWDKESGTSNSTATRENLFLFGTLSITLLHKHLLSTCYILAVC